jgi:hypothetical protein
MIFEYFYSKRERSVFMLKNKISSQKCDYFENIRRFFVILFAYIVGN